jgi:dTDP-4-dehydrorhamnose reductase
MKVITLGNGFVASHLPYEIADYRLMPNKEDIKDFLDLYKPDVVVNTIGATGRPNIDALEDQKAYTYERNVIIPAMLAQECELRNIRMIHIGSGCIFYGASPNSSMNAPRDRDWVPIENGWKENDFANSKSYYSRSKYSCDLILGDMPNITTLRIRMPISSQNNPRNFINKIRGYKQVIDIPNSVTFMSDLVRCIDWAITTNKTGIWHVTNPDPLSAADVLREYKKYVPSHQFNIIDEGELGKLTVATRSNCIINSEKLKDAGFVMTPAKIALENCMADYIKNI